MKESSQEIAFEIWSEHFLGTAERADQLISLIDRVDGGRWRPDRWGHFEPIRAPYGSASRDEIMSAVAERRGTGISNHIYFRKQKPSATMAWIVWREKVPSLNSFRATLEAKVFSGADGPERLKAIALELIEWAGAVYATVRHSRQKHYRSVPMTPEKRLAQLDWLTFFGEPYVEIFGGKARVLSVPCTAMESFGGVLLMASPKADSSEMTESEKRLLELEEYLGKDAFAGEGYPDIPCRVPTFDLSETVTGVDSSVRDGKGPALFEPVALKDPETGLPVAVAVLTPRAKKQGS